MLQEFMQVLWASFYYHIGQINFAIRGGDLICEGCRCVWSVGCRGFEGECVELLNVPCEWLFLTGFMWDALVFYAIYQIGRRSVKGKLLTTF